MILRPQEKADRLRRHRGIPGRAPAAPVITHIRALQAARWTRVEIAEATHVSRQTLRRILTEQYAAQYRTAAAILALQPGQAPSRVPALGTTRRIQALAAIGWPLAQTTSNTGIPRWMVAELAAGRSRKVPVAMAQAVDAVYRERCMQPGPSVRARKVAARNGWAPPLAWDDIDDPSETPQGVTR